jgi:hypothetical protein
MPIGSARGLVRRRSRASREWVQHDLHVSACQCPSGPAGEAAPAPSPRPSGRSSTSIRQRPRTCVPACWPPPIAAGTGRANPPHSWISTASSAHRRTRNDASLRLPRAPPQLLGVRFALAPAVRLDQAMPGPLPRSPVFAQLTRAGDPFYQSPRGGARVKDPRGRLRARSGVNSSRFSRLSCGRRILRVKVGRLSVIRHRPNRR